MKHGDRSPRLHLIVGTGGSESDPCGFSPGRTRIRVSKKFAFISEQSAGGTLLELARPKSDRFPGGDAA